MSGMTAAVAEAAGMGLLHFTWIGLLVGATMAAALQALRGQSPRARYAVALAGFVALAAVPAGTFYFSFRMLAWAPPAAKHAVAEAPAPVLLPESRVDVAMPIPHGRATAADAVPAIATPRPPTRASATEARQTPYTAGPVTVATVPTIPRDPGGLADARQDETPRPNVSASALTVDSVRAWIHTASDRAVDRIRTAAPWLAACWLAGVLFLGLRLLGGLHYTRTLRRRGTLPLEPRWQARMFQFRDTAGVRQGVRVLQSTLAGVPVVVGWLRPVVLMPASIFTGLPPAQVELLLAHELAHIKRLDPLVNLLQVLVETVLFFHPVVWWLSRRIREERELCCDDFALALCGGRADYAQALLHLAEVSAVESPLALAARGGVLHRRIHRILGLPVARERLSAPGALGLALLTLCGALVTGLAWAELARGGNTTDKRAVESRAHVLEVHAQDSEVTPVPKKMTAARRVHGSYNVAFQAARSRVVAVLADAGTAFQTARFIPDVTGNAPAAPGDGQPGATSATTDEDAEQLLALATDAPTAGEPALEGAKDAPTAVEGGLQSAIYAFESQLIETMSTLDFEVPPPLPEILAALASRHGIDIRYLPAGTKPVDVPLAKGEEMPLIDALHQLARITDQSCWVGPGYVALGGPAQVEAARADAGFPDGMPAPRVTDEVGQEHLYFVLDRWAQACHRKFVLDPYRIGPYDGADGAEYEVDGFVEPATFNDVPLDEALATLLEPLGLGHYEKPGAIPTIYVSGPRVLEWIRTDSIPQAALEIHSERAPTSVLAGLQELVGPPAIQTLAGNATAFRLPDRGVLHEDLQEVLERYFDNATEPSQRRVSIPLPDGKTWWLPGFGLALNRHKRPGADCCEGGVGLRAGEPGARCYFWRGDLYSREPLPESAFHKKGPACRPDDSEWEIQIDPLAADLLVTPWHGMMTTYPGIPGGSDTRPRTRAGRREPGLPESAFEKRDPFDRGAYLSLYTVSVNADSITVDLFCQSREKGRDENAPWTAFRCTYDAVPGEIVALVTPTEKPGESFLWLVRADHAEPQPLGGTAPAGEASEAELIETSDAAPASEVDIASTEPIPDLRPAVTEVEVSMAPLPVSESAPTAREGADALYPQGDPATVERLQRGPINVQYASALEGAHLSRELSMLRVATGIRFLLDAKTIAPPAQGFRGGDAPLGAGYATDGVLPVASERESDTAEAWLKGLTTPLGLSYLVYPDTVIISTPERLAEIAAIYRPRLHSIHARYYRISDPELVARLEVQLNGEQRAAAFPAEELLPDAGPEPWTALEQRAGVSLLANHAATAGDNSFWWHDDPGDNRTGDAMTEPHRLYSFGETEHRNNRGCGGNLAGFGTLIMNYDTAMPSATAPIGKGIQAMAHHAAPILFNQIVDLNPPRPKAVERKSNVRRGKKGEGQDRPERSQWFDASGIAAAFSVRAGGDGEYPEVHACIQQNLFHWDLAKRGEWQTLESAGRFLSPTYVYAWPTSEAGTYAMAVVHIERSGGDSAGPGLHAALAK